MVRDFNLPKEEYSLVVGGKNFTIQPLREMCLTHLRSIELFGGSIKVYPNNEFPTSIFVKYKPSKFKPVDVYNYKVVDIEMEMQMNLLDNQKDFVERLRKFILDASIAMSNGLPDNSSTESKKWVEVTNTYKY